MGTKGRTGLDRVLLGSVTENVLRTARTPVLAVPPTAGEPDINDVTFDRLLLPTDGSDGATIATEWGLNSQVDSSRRYTRSTRSTRTASLTPESSTIFSSPSSTGAKRRSTRYGSAARRRCERLRIDRDRLSGDRDSRVRDRTRRRPDRHGNPRPDGDRSVVPRERHRKRRASGGGAGVLRAGERRAAVMPSPTTGRWLRRVPG